MNFDNHLTEVATTRQELECFLGFFEREDPVDDRVNLLLLVKTVHFLEAILRAVDDTLEGHSTAKSEEVDVQTILVSVHLARNVADAVNQSTKSDAIKALAQSFGTTNLENNVNAPVLGELVNLLFPVRVGAVVDSEIGTQLLGLVQFRIRRGGDDYYWRLETVIAHHGTSPTFCASSLGNL